MKPNLRKQYISLLTLLLLMLSSTAQAKFTWTMPPVGPGGIGQELMYSINIGTIVKPLAFSDARDSRYYQNVYENKGKDICYQFDILEEATVIIDSSGSTGSMGKFYLYREFFGGGGINKIEPDQFSEIPFLEELPDYYANETDCDNVYILGPGHYFLVHEGASGNTGAYDGIYVTNLYAFPEPEISDFGTFENPIPIIRDRIYQDYVDLQTVESYHPSYIQDGLPDISYEVEITQPSHITIKQPVESYCKSVYYLLDATGRFIAQSDGTNELERKSLEPGYYIIVNKALTPSGRIGVHVSINKDSEAPGFSAKKPVDSGTYNTSFKYTKNYESKHYLTDTPPIDYGPSALFCKVSLLKNMVFKCTMTGSCLQKITILNTNGEQVDYTQDPGSSWKEKTITLSRDMPQGEYIVVFETKDDSHPVGITIEGICPTTGPARDQLALLPTENYTLTTSPIVATQDIKTLLRNQVQFNVDYTDGLGRIKQRIDIWGSNGEDDIIQTVTYDAAGRNDSITYLPYVSQNNSGLFRSASASEQTSFYRAKFGNDSDVDYTFTKKLYDNAGQVVAETTIGETGTLHPVQHEYRLNAANEVRHYRVSDSDGLIYSGYYPAGTLQVHVNWQSNLPAAETIRNYEYTNAQGQKIGVRIQTAAVDEITYNVYDELGHLCFSIPAIIGDTLSINKTYSAEELRLYAFYYKYDRYGRQTEAWIPGAEPIYQLYDKLGQVVMKQTGIQRANGKNEWTFVKYDELGRQILTGTYTGGSREEHAAMLRAQTIIGEKRGNAIHGYTNQSYPLIASENDVLSASYYDDYDWMPTNSSCVFSQADRLGDTYSTEVQGLPTGSKSKVLGIDEDRWLTAAIYYDDQYRTIQSVTELYPRGVEIVSNKHDFIGNVVQTKVKQTVGAQSHEYNKWFDFDTSGRPLAARQKITGDARNGEVTIASYTYDDLGQTASKQIHNSAETSRYTYRLGGTQSAMTSPSFSYALGFDRPVTGQAARYDGKMSDMAWGRGMDMTQGYRFDYDAKGQMAGALHAEQGSGVWNSKTSFNEDGISYDKNGNILTMHRSDVNGQELHNLVYHYDGNRLHSVTQNGADSNAYTYDADGNMTYDGLRGVGIEYNELNLPKRIFAGSDEIRYIYNSDGQKLASVANGSFTYYRSVMVYGQSAPGAGENLLYMLQPDGIVTHNSTGDWTYKYFKKDHLGSTRVLLAATETSSGVQLTPEQNTDYYPYGLAWSHDDLHQNRYLYNGKELQDAAIGKLGLLGLYDFEARYYDPMLGRWFNIDPALQLLNPYLFCGNSPMMFIDKDGRWIWILIGALAGAYLSGVQANGGNWNPLEWDWRNTWGNVLGGAAVGAFGGWAASAAAGAVGGLFAVKSGAAYGLATGAVGGFTGGFISGSGMSWMNGAGFGEGLLLGVNGALFGGLTGGILSGTINGFQAVRAGNNFWTGAAPKAPITPNLTPERMALIDELNGLRPSREFDIYPSNDGFANTPAPRNILLQPGSQIDRFGEEYGKFFAPKDTPIPARALPPSNNGNYNAYEVIQEIPAKSGVTAPFYGKPGGGIQIMTNKSAEQLLKQGYIKRINTNSTFYPKK